MTSATTTNLTAPTFEEARAQFPALAKIAYLNAGTFGPVSLASVDAVRGEIERDFNEGRTGIPYFLRVMELRETLRASLAALISTEPARIALTASTTNGCNIVLSGLELGPDDEIVTTTDEHAGLLLPLHASSARVVVVAPDPDAILAAVTSRTRLLALSHVLWTTGRVLPVAELRAESGIPVLVDGAQSVGAIPVDASGFDYLTISGQKWLCGPDATGALFVAEPESLGIATPSAFSKETHEPDGSFAPRPGAARFDPNWWPASSLAGLLASIEARPGWGFAHAAAVAARCRELLAERVEVVTPAHGSTLVSFRAPHEPTALVESMYRSGVHVREIPGTGLIRVSCGWWTSDGDLDRLLAALPA